MRADRLLHQVLLSHRQSLVDAWAAGIVADINVLPPEAPPRVRGRRIVIGRILQMIGVIRPKSVYSGWLQ
jgi:hypothetical protein